MTKLLNMLSERLHIATQELLDMFAINVDANDSQTASDINDTDD